MVKEVHVEGLPAFLEAVKGNEGKEVYAYFSGTKSSDGKSWCPDCVAAEPVVKKGVKDAADDAIFIYCGVGDRATWKDPKCVFRTHADLRLTGVPTLMKWGTNKRLGDEDCSKAELVEMIFEDS